MNRDTAAKTILHLIEHLRVGGAERVVADLIQHLDQHRFNNILLLYRDTGAFAEELKRKDYRIIFMKKDLLSASLGFMPRILLAPVVLVESMVFIVRLSFLLRRERVSLVHSHMFSANLWGILAAKLLGRTPFISTIHTVMTGLALNAMHRFAQHKLLPLSDRIVAVSEEVADSIRAYQDLAPGKLEVIPNGVSIPTPEQVSREAPNLPGHRPRLIAVSRLVGLKRLDVFLKAIPQVRQHHPQVTVLIVGQGPEEASLRKQCSLLGLDDIVFILGERMDVEEILRQGDIFVNTSDHEGLSRSILEAMANGLPVVATDVGGTPTLVQTGKTGILIPSGDSRAAADAITRLLNDLDHAAILGGAGRELVKESFSFERITEKWENLYQEISR